MPNLNVKGETSKPAAAPGGGGGASKTLLIVVLAVVAVGAVLFVLNSTGVVKLWGKKKPVPVVVDVPVETSAPVVQEATPVPDTQSVDMNKMADENLTKVESNAPGKKTVVTGTGMYTIQISSWPDEKRAAMQAQVFQDAGFEAFVEPLGKYFRVCVGRFESKKEARKKAESMAHMLESMYMISKVGN